MSTIAELEGSVNSLLDRAAADEVKITGLLEQALNPSVSVLTADDQARLDSIKAKVDAVTAKPPVA